MKALVSMILLLSASPYALAHHGQENGADYAYLPFVAIALIAASVAISHSVIALQKRSMQLIAARTPTPVQKQRRLVA